MIERVRQLSLSLPLSRIEWSRALTTWWQAARLDLAILAAITVLAAVPRLVLLETIPPGMHGDEASVAMDALRVLKEGWIGPYSPNALGYPNGPIYFAAPIINIFGETLFAARLSMALLGIITIPVAYLTFRVMFDRTLATFAAILLALGLWHLHYSRIAFPVIAWPLMELLTLLFLFLGIRTNRWFFFGLAGLALGAGIYTYNAHPVFALPLGLFVLWVALRERRQHLIRFAGQIALVIGLATFAALPMILYATEPGHPYLQTNRGLALSETDDWKSRDLTEKGQLVFDRTRDFYLAAYWHGAGDGADGAGSEAMVDRVTIVLLAIGAAISVWRWRQLGAVAVLLIVIVIPFGSILTVNGMFRRSLGMVPFLAALAAAPLALWWRRAERLSLPWRSASYAGIALIVAAVGFFNLNFYFTEFPNKEIVQFTFVGELTEASKYMNDLPDDAYVYFYSGRWSLFYETRLYLAPDVEGVDRSNEFGEFSLTPTQPGPVVYVLLAPYLDQADEVARLYPGGTLTESVRNDGVVNFRAYYLPSTEGVAEPPADVTPEPTVVSAEGAAERDATRQQDFIVIAGALEQYKQEYGAYPDTGGQVQSFCVYPDDAGCALEEVLDPIPQDPLGDPGANGYWYAATKNEYRVYSKRETDTIPLCPEHPPHLGGFDSIYCVIGP